MVNAGKRLNETGDTVCVSFLQRKCGQLQSCNPALGTRRQRSNIFCGEFEPHQLVKKLGRLIMGESQIGNTQLGQLPPTTQTCQRQSGIDARGDD